MRAYPVLTLSLIALVASCGSDVNDNATTAGEFRAPCSETAACSNDLECNGGVCVGSISISGFVTSAFSELPERPLHVALFRLPDARSRLPVVETLLERLFNPAFEFPIAYELHNVARGSFCVVAYIPLEQPEAMALRGDSCFTIDATGPVSLDNGTPIERVDVAIIGQSPLD